MGTIIIFIWIWAAMVANGFWEAYVEGKRAWDEGKLGWKIKTKKRVWLTAYHFWLFFVMWPLLLTLPFIIFGFDLKLLGILLSAFFSGLIIEDLTWFIVNPVFKLKHFNSNYVEWYPWLKIGKFEMPLYYLIALILSIVSWYFLWSQ
ncbi:MAG: hypothetical protein IIC69_00900 [Nanoarchaeota archaeon]|nr:hypothetical protein [Nanoarchaeota archaeon]